jgi:Domain of unknown function (DUF4166)
MPSIYATALGCDFSRLHPQIQKRYGFDSSSGVAAICGGTMQRIWHGPFYTLPFLHVGSWRRIMFPEHGENIPFTVENYAYRDEFDRETVTWLRSFQMRKLRRFDEYMIFSERRKRVVIYLGTHQHLAADTELSIDPRGGLRMRSGDQRIYEQMIGFRFPMVFSAIANVCEWYDDAEKKFRIEVDVSNRIFGKVFGCNGFFDVEWLSIAPEQVPSYARPIRQERRD